MKRSRGRARIRMDVRTASAAGTLRVGRRLASRLSPGDVVTLSGDVGSGKTTLAKGLVCGLGAASASRQVSSPTFTIIQDYPGRVRVRHIDWYRLRTVAGVDREMAEECLADPQAVSIVEWPERAPDLVPGRAIRVRLAHAGGNRRRILVR